MPQPATGAGEAQRARATVCCLTEGDYHLGVAALAHSLQRANYDGTLWVGRRGPLPPWAKGRETIELPGGMRLAFVEIAPGRHISHEKARFMLRVMEELEPRAAAVAYFDADATVRADWRFFEAWIGIGEAEPPGVAACIDHCYPFVPFGHPWRRAWRRLLEGAGLPVVRTDLEHYVPSSFLGVPRERLDLLRDWDTAMDAVLAAHGEAGGVLKLDDPAHPFKNPDQDALNAALMASEGPLNLMGPEAMDFWPAGFVMSQGSMARKPWRASWLREALAGAPPTRADKEYWRYAEGPLAPFAPATVRRRRATLKLAAAVGRVYRRG